MILKSKFKLVAFLPVALLALITGFLIIFSILILNDLKNATLIVYVVIALFIFVWIWLYFGELRTKVIKVTIEEYEITVSNYFGLHTKKIYPLSGFDGFKTSLMPFRYEAYEFLYLMANDKKVIKLSGYYHKNYDDLKAGLSLSLKDLGDEKFSLLSEVKEIFV